MREFSIKKLYYSISEVSKITEVEQYVLRYWEGEFEQLNPQKNRSGNRAYTNKDIQLIFVIKVLLRDKKYTIEGAKRILAEKSIEELIAENIAEQKVEEKKPKVEEISVKKEIEDVPILIPESELRELIGILRDLYKFF